jgi:hypothetical protein
MHVVCVRGTHAHVLWLPTLVASELSLSAIFGPGLLILAKVGELTDLMVVTHNISLIPGIVPASFSTTLMP